MPNGSDAMLARLQAELEERRMLMDAIVEGAQEESRDMRPDELESYNRARDRMADLEAQMTPLREGARIALSSASRTRELQALYASVRNPDAPTSVEYRSVGAYIVDLYSARMGDDESAHRIDLYNRVAAHQTTADNPGLLPEQIVGPVVNFVDAARPLVTAIGPEDLGIGTWSYARVTQHTQVGVQSAEKAELPSRKMTVTTTPITAPTLGGYVNVSRQNIVRTSPGILDMIVNDLAAQYAIETEAATAAVLEGAATVGPTYPADATALQIAQAVYGAAGMAAGAVGNQGRLIIALGTAAFGVVGPLMPSVNPINGFGTGFSAANAGAQGPNGSISGITAVMSTALDPDAILVLSSAAVRAFEYRYGNLQVVEPSVWGVQVGYAGDYEAIVIEPAGIVSIAQA